MAKIVRPPGTVSFHDAYIRVWEEPSKGTNGHGLPTGYRETFNRDVLGSVVKLMRQRRWHVSSDPETDRDFPILRHDHKWCIHPCGLQCRVRLSGRCLELKFYQNIARPKNAHPRGGEYDYNRLEGMPYLMRKRCEMEMDHIAGWLIFNCEYEFKPDRPKCHADLGGVDVDTWLEYEWKYNRFERKRPDPTQVTGIPSYNSKCQDGHVRNGDRVYFLWPGLNARWGVGIAEHNINNMWWVKVGTHELHNVASHYISRKVPELGLRGRRYTNEYRRCRLEGLMLQAAEERRYRDAERMRVALENKRYEASQRS